jgi:predicted glycosyltransferase
VSGKRVFLYVQHLLGIGHLRRATTLANALATKGLEVTLASGGFVVPGLRLEGVKLVQLPPASAADSSFKALVAPDGQPVDEDWKDRRSAMLLETWRDADPHVVIFELYPFGRRQMRFELTPLLEAISSSARKPMIVSSVRDLLGAGQANTGRQDGMLELFERYFDRLLVHADPAMIQFDKTFRHAARIGSRLHYTGYVVDSLPLQVPAVGGDGVTGTDEVVVSAGGGAVGMRLLETAMHARPLTRLANRTWRILSGVNATSADFEALSALAIDSGQGRVTVERARTDFTYLLENCAVSVSQGGYNTLMESIRAGARSVVVPFAGGSETEQTLRARSFAAAGLIEVVEEDQLTPQSLAIAIDRAAGRARPQSHSVNLDGTRRTADLVAEWALEIAW